MKNKPTACLLTINGYFRNMNRGYYQKSKENSTIQSSELLRWFLACNSLSPSR
ncbi:MAG: hypothetical protein ACJAQ2_001641 [Vicingaceae bacterium]|jgi:hypothetical protein